MPTLEAAALAAELAAAGIPIYPVWPPDDGGCGCGNPDCEHPAKHPLGNAGFAPNGIHSATCDPEIIRSWFTRSPDINFAVATGHQLPLGGYLIVVDVDRRHGGDKTLAALEAQHGALPRTATVQTGGGGLHIYLSAPEPARNCEFGPGLELKGTSGSVVAPPSRHASGERYRWMEPFDPGVLALVGPPQAPAWLVERATQRKAPESSPTSPDALIPNGQRNMTLTSLAGALRRAGAAQSVIEAPLSGVNGATCDPPLDEREVRSIAHSMSRYEPDTGSQRRVVATRGSDISTEEVRWAWQDRIPLGALTIIAGMQGLGKSTLCYGIAAKTTTGHLEGDLKGDPSSVLVVTLEDHLASVARPRFLASKGDPNLVEFVTVELPDGEGLVTLPDDLDGIERLIIERRTRLLVIDPIVATLNGSLDSHRDQDARSSSMTVAWSRSAFRRQSHRPIHQSPNRCDPRSCGPACSHGHDALQDSHRHIVARR